MEGINVSSILPEGKDYERALDLAYKDDPDTPQASKADRMAKLIKDPQKLVRRAKAVVGIWGTQDYYNDREELEQVALPFMTALFRMGFTAAQIKEISEFEIDVENL